MKIKKASMIVLALIWLTLLAAPLTASQEPTSSARQDTAQATSESIMPAIPQAIQNAQPKWSITFGKVIWSAIIMIIGLISLKYMTRLLDTLAERWVNFRLAIKRLVPILRVSGWTLVCYIIIADVLAPPIATLLALTASAGIAVGFAAQDILKNIFGGITILFDRPFQVGDKIEVGGHYGEVVSVGLRTVRVVTPDDSLVAIPNSEIVNQSVSNANSGEFNCQVVAEFYLPPTVDLVKVKKTALRAAAISRYVYLNKPIAIVIKNEIHQGRSMLKMRLKAYVSDTRYEFLFASEMTEIVMQELLKQGLVDCEDLVSVPAHPAST